VKSSAPRETRQRKAILHAVRSLGNHPTAEHVYEEVRKEIPRISLGTVYRNLQHLVADGQLAMAPVGERIARFDPMTVSHDHFVCERCGSIFDVLRDRTGTVDFRNLEGDGFRVRAHALSIFGICPSCAAGVKGNE
jgi:Fe2+ or Zn2+ uptake regulation protein